MATTRIMPLHVGKGRTESRAISDIIDYVANPKKTDDADSLPAMRVTAGLWMRSSFWQSGSTCRYRTSARRG
mgnify:CR=1 FL=1